MNKLLKFETGVYYAQGFNSWGVLHVGEWLFRIWNGTGKSFVWRLELFTPKRKFRLIVGW
jgi:hypothetical protein